MSERVRKARALDAVEKVVWRCCDMAVDKASNSDHITNELTFVIGGAVDEVSCLHSVDREWLAREAMRMLGNELNRFLRPVCQVAYVKPCQRDGAEVGMTVRFYVLGRSVA